MPLPYPFTFSAGSGSAIDEFPEGFLSGETAARVAELQVRMSNGEVLTVEPHFAPGTIRQRFAWLKGTRFFALFFPSTEKPRLVTAFDRGGHGIGRSKSDHGIFFHP